MVISFVFATIACIILGTIFLELFKLAIPAANGQSMIGLVKGFSLIAVFMSLTLALVHTCFGMTSLITDQTLAWIGGHMNSALGAKHDQEAGNVVVAGVNTGKGAVGSGVGNMGKGAAAKEQKDAADQKHKELLGALGGGSVRNPPP